MYTVLHIGLNNIKTDPDEGGQIVIAANNAYLPFRGGSIQMKSEKSLVS